jgi:hypothetical protein
MWRWTLLLAGLAGVLAGTGQAGAAPAPRQRPVLRVLVLTGASTREYQFLRTLLVREKEKNRLYLRIVHQSAGFRKVLADADDPCLMEQFPDRLEPAGKTEADKDAALGSYDVFVTFDPDWQKLTAAQISLVVKWVKQGGGLIVVPGPVHTFPLGRPNLDPIHKPIADLLPVVLDDERLVQRTADTAWRLHFGKVKNNMTFLKLDPKGEGPLTGWEEFFCAGKKPAKGEAPVEHGFYSYYPVKEVKEGAVVLATFADPKARIGGQEQPYMAAWKVGKGLVFYLGSGEMWRLRQHKEEFHERFWLELLSFASLGGASLK